MTKSLDFCFFASSRFGLAALRTILKCYRPTVVVTVPAQPQGRGLKLEPNIVYSFALAEKLPILEVKNFEHWADRFEVGLVAGFGKIIPPTLFGNFQRGILNLHPSLLPSYRGANPISQVILDGKNETGVTLFVIDEQIDHGPIIAQRTFTLNNTETTAALEQRLGQLGGELVNQTLGLYLAGALTPTPQDHAVATTTKKLTKLDGQLNATDAYQIWDRKIRALNPWPGTYLKINLKSKLQFLKIFKIERIPDGHLSPEQRPVPIGAIFVHRNRLSFRLADAAVAVLELQLEGKKRMTSREFLNGYSINALTLV